MNPIIQFEKVCPSCHQLRPITEFGKNRSKPDGRTSYCKPCANEQARAYYATPEGRAARAATHARSRAKAKARYQAAVAKLSPADRARLGL